MERKTITISNIESPVGKIVLCEQVPGKQYPVKYSFFQKTQQGQTSKAYEQFLSMEIQSGDTVDISFDETQGVNKVSGKPVTYRNIKFFYEGETTHEQTSSSTISTPQAPSQPSNESRLDKMATWAKQITLDIDGIKSSILELEGSLAMHEDSVVAHKSTPEPAIPTVIIEEDIEVDGVKIPF